MLDPGSEFKLAIMDGNLSVFAESKEIYCGFAGKNFVVEQCQRLRGNNERDKVLCSLVKKKFVVLKSSAAVTNSTSRIRVVMAIIFWRFSNWVEAIEV